MGEKDQAKVQSAVKEPTYGEGFDSAFAEFIEAGNKPDEAPEKEPEKKAETKAEPDCPGCDKEKKAAEEKRTPYRILKVNGKEVPVYSEQELADLAQQGVDYTQKRQLDSDEKRKWEGEYENKHKELTDLTEKYERLFQQIKPGERIPGTDQAVKPIEPVNKKDLYAEYGIDPEYADSFQKKAIDDMANLQGKIGAYEQKIQQIEAFTNQMILKDTATKIGAIIKEEKEKYPFDDIMSEDGKQNLTYSQFASLLLSKEQQAKAEGRKVDLAEIVRETVRDVHYIQAKSKATAAPAVANELSPDEFAKQYPDLYKKLEERIKGGAVADYEADKAKIPPSLETKKIEVNPNKVNEKTPESPDDWIDKGFSELGSQLFNS